MTPRSFRSRAWPQLLLAATVTLLLAPSFASNRWGVAPEGRFDRFQEDTEAHVLGRLVLSRDRGILAAGGLTGIGLDAPPPAGKRTWPDAKVARAQYRAYLRGETFGHFSPYFSQPGGQAMLLGLLDRVLPLPPARRLAIYRGIDALLTAAVLGLVVVWFQLELGWAAAAIAAASMLASLWLTIFGRNLWWSLWAFYLPLAMMMVWLRRGGAGAGRRFRCVGVTFLAVSLKCWFNGYEFMTTTLVMMAVPFVYYALVAAPGWRVTLRAAAGMAAAAAAAIALSLALLSVQIGSASGAWSAGPRHLRSSLEHRSVGHSAAPGEIRKANANATRGELLRMHLRTTFSELAGAPGGGEDPAPASGRAVSFGALVVLFAASSALLLALGFSAPAGEEARRGRALVAATWFSMLAPLSWLVLFRAHSARHLHVNPITWQMPFTLFGFALVGATLAALVRSVLSSRFGPRIARAPIADE
ncbi:MAG TPA: hypothetical protein VI942_11860 [Thermoanaerobaculia bacterium]|nr:hypothetical protein [Thermoanaerobaculia bacterium]